jgi:hypothetical protein
VAVDPPPFAEPVIDDPLRPASEVTGMSLVALVGGASIVLLMLRVLLRDRMAWLADKREAESEPFRRASVDHEVGASAGAGSYSRAR